eukprot:TRINITY_DN106229_c0_g1_i1.p1 TRINITY_DN106229_c0_g1~~TRINITY_DN106229_c0_g1_i1.p1  ORF type:complete len:288 (+),score=54.96 TRINITY_DN106229_c0_g1_i1:68-931(+)
MSLDCCGKDCIPFIGKVAEQTEVKTQRDATSGQTKRELSIDTESLLPASPKIIQKQSGGGQVPDANSGVCEVGPRHQFYSREEELVHERDEKAVLQAADVATISKALAAALPCQGMHRLEIEGVAKSFIRVKFDTGDCVIQTGDLGSYYFVIKSGRARVEAADGKFIRELCPGDAFGEVALIKHCPRTATVYALEDLTCWAVHGTDFEQAFIARIPVNVMESSEQVVCQVREALADLAQRSTRVASWLEDTYNLEKRILLHGGDASRVTECLRSELPRRFKLRSAWD